MFCLVEGLVDYHAEGGGCGRGGYRGSGSGSGCRNGDGVGASAALGGCGGCGCCAAIAASRERYSTQRHEGDRQERAEAAPATERGKEEQHCQGNATAERPTAFQPYFLDGHIGLSCGGTDGDD